MLLSEGTRDEAIERAADRPHLRIVSADDSVAGVSIRDIGSWGYVVTSCATHEAASGSPDLVLIEDRIGAGVVLACLRSLRAQRAFVATPVVVVLSSSETAPLRQFMDAGADDCILPSATSEPLRRAIAARLERFRAMSARLGETAHEVSDRRETEEALRESEAVLNGIIDNAEEAICLLDSDGRELWCNPSFVTLMPASGYESERMRFADRLHPSDRPSLSIAIERAHNAGRSGTFEYRTLDRSGNVRHFEANICVVEHASGHPGRFITISRDVTGRKRAEHNRTMTRILLDEAQRLESIGRLASGIAHEINTPTQFVGDNLRFLRSSFGSLIQLAGNLETFLAGVETAGEADEEQLRLLRAALEGCELDYMRSEVPASLDQSMEGIQRVARIVHAMRDFSHPGSPDKVPADLNRAIESTTVVARSEWKYVSDLELDLDPDMGEVACSIGELNQVFLNLIVNAAHAVAEKMGEAASGKGRISISTRRTKTHAVVHVQDTGRGISPEVQPHVFEPFFTTKPVGKGTGQGLAIARSVVVDHHGGEITYETIPGFGTCFTVRIPLRPAQAVHAA